MAEQLTQIKRLRKPLRPGELPRALEAPAALETEAIELAPVDFGPFREALDIARSNGRNTSEQRSRWDRDLAEPFHRALGNLSASDGLDIGVWHWLCVSEFPDFVRERWAIDPGSSESGVPPPSYNRYLGTSSLSGFARNCLARLWWAGHTLFSEEDGYSLVRAVFDPQDLFTSVFERDLVLNRDTVRACVQELQHKDGKSVQIACKRLNQWATTLHLELLEVSEIRQLLKEAL